MNESAKVLKRAVDALFGINLKPKPLTEKTLSPVLEAVTASHANALLLRTLINAQIGSLGASYHGLKEAERQGATHPIQYYFLGEIYREGVKGVKRNIKEAIGYYAKAIAGKTEGTYHILFRIPYN